MKEENFFRLESLGDGYRVLFYGVFDIHKVDRYAKELQALSHSTVYEVDLSGVSYFDTAAALFMLGCFPKKSVTYKVESDTIQQTLLLVQRHAQLPKPSTHSYGLFEQFGSFFHKKWLFLLELFHFIGVLFAKKISLLFQPKNFRYKEILYEITQSGIKAVGIVALTSFLVGVVIAYQSSVQLKLYGANIFIVDMLGISILRELAPMITAIVIAGRSGSAYTAEIGAMKITQELDAMRTMGFDPYFYLVIPRIIALAIVLPILIFVADAFGVFGGMIIALSDLDISFGFFIERFREVVAWKHFFIGEFKGPFFAFLIAIISIYRGFMVKDDTQSIGKNTTKSVVESIFAVIVCDALFSIVFTNLGV